MTIEEEIIILTAKWYKYVNLDHHKDRDCHWYVTKTYSYGEEPYYEASHAGYILDHWTSPRCGTEEMAQTLLRNKLDKIIKEEVNNLQNMDEESLEWLGISKNKLEEIIKELT